MNPLLNSKRLPGQTVRLPSGGLFYTNGELDETVKNGEIHVYPLTAYHEILLKTPDFLLNGVAVEKIFHDCIPQVLKPLDLTTKDVDFLFVCLRKITFGDDIEFKYNHYCENSKEYNYIINVSSMLERTIRVDPTTVKKVYEIPLDNGFTIKTRPLRFGDFVTLNQIPSNQLVSPEDKFNYIINSLLATIEAVILESGEVVTDIANIGEWLETLSADIFRDITQKINEGSKWGPVFNTKCKCKDCGEDFEIDIPVNPVLVFF